MVLIFRLIMRWDLIRRRRGLGRKPAINRGKFVGAIGFVDKVPQGLGTYCVPCHFRDAEITEQGEQNT